MKLRSLLYDGKLAAKLGRLSWLLMVTAFVILISARLSAAHRDLCLSLLAAVVIVMNVPSAMGAASLWQQGERSGPMKMLLFVLGLRVLSFIALVWVLRLH